MQQKIIPNKSYFEDLVSKIKAWGYEKIHILADFDRTLTKCFTAWQKRWTLISVLRSEWYLSEEYTKKAYELYDYYNPIEINPNISLEEKKKEMTIWWNKHLDLLVNSSLHKSHIDRVINSWIIEFRDGVVEFLNFLSENKIPLVIISANWLWTDSIKLFFQKNNVLTDNVYIISNSFVWWGDDIAVWYDKRVVHVFNKDETILSDFPEIHEKIENRKNVILLWDSLWDPLMIEWFEYENLLKIGFLNDKEEELEESYRKSYDLVLTWDSDFYVWEEVLK